MNNKKEIKSLPLFTTLDDEAFIFKARVGSPVVTAPSLPEPSFMTINIGSDLTRPLPDGLSQTVYNPGGVCLERAAGERHVPDCVETISFTRSGKKHRRGRVSYRMHPLTPTGARARCRRFRELLCASASGGWRGRSALAERYLLVPGGSPGRGRSLRRATFNAHSFNDGSAAIFLAPFWRTPPSSVAPWTDCSVFFTRTSSARTEPTVCLRSARAMTLGDDCILS